MSTARAGTGNPGVVYSSPLTVMLGLQVAKRGWKALKGQYCTYKRHLLRRI